MADGQRSAASEPKPYWRPLRPGETVYILDEIVSEPEEKRGLSTAGDAQKIKTVFEKAPRIDPAQIPENIETIICETTERLVRDMAPGIIERVIREEIEKLKMDHD